MEAIASCCRPVSLSWHTMFQQLRDIHDLGHGKAIIPPRIVHWMSTQQRQYRVYGIGLKEPVGIIKQRVNKLNSLGFEWNPSLVYSSDRTKWVHDNDDEEGPLKTSTPSERTEEKQDPAAKKRERDNSAEGYVYSGSVTGITQRGPGKKWEVRVSFNGGKRKYIGSYETHAEANEALRRARCQSTDITNGRLYQRSKLEKSGQVLLNRCKKSTPFGCYQTHAEAADAGRIARRKFKEGNSKFTIQQLTDKQNSTGVTLRGGCAQKKWEVRVCHEGKRRLIGYFETQSEAVKALRRARNRMNSNGNDKE